MVNLKVRISGCFLRCRGSDPPPCRLGSDLRDPPDTLLLQGRLDLPLTVVGPSSCSVLPKPQPVSTQVQITPGCTVSTHVPSSVYTW